MAEGGELKYLILNLNKEVLSIKVRFLCSFILRATFKIEIELLKTKTFTFFD